VRSCDGDVSARSKMCSAEVRQRFARAGLLVLNTMKHCANAAASRPARFGLTGEPAGPARNTGRFRM
jgi:hypothetical protein